MEELNTIFNPECFEQSSYKPIDGLNPEEIREDFMEIRTDMEGFEGKNVIVTGNPFEVAPYLDAEQGDNDYNCGGCCGLNSCSNVLTLAGIESSENKIVTFAVENDLCYYNDSWFSDPSENGGVHYPQIEEILERHNVEATTHLNIPWMEDRTGSLEGIASAVESGHGAIITVNAETLWGESTLWGDKSANHAITVTGTQRDADTGELIGFVICDSGYGDACRSVTLEQMNECYTEIIGTGAVITDNPIR